LFSTWQRQIDMRERDDAHEHAASDNLIGGCWSLRFSKRLD
jgi:hypothetical protein